MTPKEKLNMLLEACGSSPVSPVKERGWWKLNVASKGCSARTEDACIEKALYFAREFAERRADMVRGYLEVSEQEMQRAALAVQRNKAALERINSALEKCNES